MEQKMSNIDDTSFFVLYSRPPGLLGESPPMAVEMAGEEQCGPGYRIYRDNADIGVLIYVQAGQASVTLAQGEEILSAGDVLLLPPDCLHSYRASREAPCRIQWFNVAGELFTYLLARYRLDRRVLYRGVAPQVAEAFGAGLALCTGQEHPTAQQDRLCGQVYTILLTLGRYCVQNATPAPGIAGRLREAIDRRMAADQGCGFSMEEASRQLNLSVRQLERDFKAQYGKTPYRYFQEQKLAVARQYLKNTALSVKEISNLLGFCDPYYFSNCFKRQQKCSPRDYRRGDY